MTNEQWLVYLWSIYPNGGFIHLWSVMLIVFATGMMFVAVHHFGVYTNEETLWSKLGKWKIAIPSILVLFIFLSLLVPKRDHFLLIIATPYAVEAGKSLADSLNDPTSKMFKLNQLVDKGLEKMLQELSEPNNKKDVDKDKEKRIQKQHEVNL